MMERLDRYAPPGMDLSGIRRWTVGAIVVSALFSMIFLSEYATELSELRQIMEHPVYAGRTMTPFGDLIVLPMILFRIAPFIPLVHIPSMYGYYFQESKSIYVMKRLKNPFELHLRCLTLPILAALLVVLSGAAVYLLYRLFYYICTPEILLPAAL